MYLMVEAVWLSRSSVTFQPPYLLALVLPVVEPGAQAVPHSWCLALTGLRVGLCLTVRGVILATELQRVCHSRVGPATHCGVESGGERVC